MAVVFTQPGIADPDESLLALEGVLLALELLPEALQQSGEVLQPGAAALLFCRGGSLVSLPEG